MLALRRRPQEHHELYFARLRACVSTGCWLPSTKKQTRSGLKNTNSVVDEAICLGNAGTVYVPVEVQEGAVYDGNRPPVWPFRTCHRLRRLVAVSYGLNLILLATSCWPCTASQLQHLLYSVLRCTRFLNTKPMLRPSAFTLYRNLRKKVQEHLRHKVIATRWSVRSA